MEEGLGLIRESRQAALLRNTEKQVMFSQGSKEAMRELAEQRRLGRGGTTQSNLTRVPLCRLCCLTAHKPVRTEKRPGAGMRD